MRARQLKPGFFKNEDLAECSPWARLVFAGLWTMADRAGRLEDRPKRIKAELLPFDTEPIGSILDELERWGFIRRYRENGRDLMWIPRFNAHQNPHKNEKESELPPHPDDPWSQAAKYDPHGPGNSGGPGQYGGTGQMGGPGGCDHKGSPEKTRSSNQTGQDHSPDNVSKRGNPCTADAPGRHGAGTVQAPCEYGSRRASSPIASFPITSSPIPSTPVSVRFPAHPPTQVSEPSASTIGYRLDEGGENPGSGGGGHVRQACYEAQAYAVSLEIQQIGEGYPPERFDPGAADTALKEVSKRRQWPGLDRVLTDLTARLACEQWTRENGRFAPMLSRYIRERMWLMKVPEQRAAPDTYASPESKAIDDIAQKLRRKEHTHEHPEFSEGDTAKRPGSAAAPGAAFPAVQAGERVGPVG